MTILAQCGHTARCTAETSVLSAIYTRRPLTWFSSIHLPSLNLSTTLHMISRSTSPCSPRPPTRTAPRWAEASQLSEAREKLTFSLRHEHRPALQNLSARSQESRDGVQRQAYYDVVQDQGEWHGSRYDLGSRFSGWGRSILNRPKGQMSVASWRAGRAGHRHPISARISITDC